MIALLKQKEMFIFASIAVTMLAVLIARRRERRNETELLKAIEAPFQKDSKRHYIRISQPVGSLPLLWFPAALIWLIGKTKEYNLFYLYLYFFAAGLFPPAYSLLSYCKLRKDILILSYGSFLNRRCIALFWKDMDRVFIDTLH